MEKQTTYKRPVGIQVALDSIEVIVRGFDWYGLQKMSTLMGYIEGLESQLQSRSLPVYTTSPERISIHLDYKNDDGSVSHYGYIGSERRSKKRGG